MDFTSLAGPAALEATMAALEKNGIRALAVDTGAQALETIRSLIPAGASVMNGSSRTLEQIGFIDLLKSGSHGWDNLHEAVIKEKDPAVQARLRKESVLSDYYVGSAHAVAQTGEFVIGSNTGSQLPHIAYTSGHLIFVVSTKKIVPTLADAFDRLERHVVPLEDANIMGKYGIHTMLAKILVFKRENPSFGRSVHMVLVREDLGF